MVKVKFKWCNDQEDRLPFAYPAPTMSQTEKWNKFILNTGQSIKMTIKIMDQEKQWYVLNEIIMRQQ